MSEVIESTETSTDASANSVSSESEEKVEDVKVEAKADPVVSFKDHQRALQDLSRFKQEAAASAEKLKSMEMQKLKEAENWQEIARLKEQEAAEFKEKYQNTQNAIIRQKKMGAIEKFAQEAGMRKEALDDLSLYDWSDVEIETTSHGNINVLGAKEAIERFKMQKPFFFGRKSISVNSETPGLETPSKVTVEDVLKAEKAARKSGDIAPYQALLKKYQTQNNS